MKKNNVIKNIIKLSLLLLVIWGSISSIQAAPYNSFSIKPSIPDNQINKKVSYFDLLLNEKHQQEIIITINNDGADTMVASTNVNNAVTSDNGTINYLSANVKDESQKISVNEVVVVNQPKVEIAPYSSATVTMSINLGDNNFTGNILGGIVVKASSDKISNDKNEQLSIDNEIAYVIGLKLSMNPDVIVKPDLKLIETKGILHDHKTGVGALILNDEPTIMKEVKIVGEVYEKNSNKVISSVDLPNAGIAPNTRFNVIYD